MHLTQQCKYRKNGHTPSEEALHQDSRASIHGWSRLPIYYFQTVNTAALHPTRNILGQWASGPVCPPSFKPPDPSTVRPQPALANTTQYTA